MLSGYYRAGLLGLGLAGAIAGAMLTSHIVQPRPPTGSCLGMSVIGIFAVVLMGTLYGALSTSLAACLLLAPLLGGRSNFLGCAGGRQVGACAGRLACVAIPLMVVVIVAQWKFMAATTARHSSSGPNAVHDLSEE